MIAYNGTNAFTGLGSVTIYIFIYFFNVFLVFLLKFYILATGGKYGGQWLLEKTIKDLFFNLIISMTILYFFSLYFSTNFSFVGNIFKEWKRNWFKRIWREMGSSLWILKDKKQVDQILQFGLCIKKIFVRDALFLQKWISN